MFIKELFYKDLTNGFVIDNIKLDNNRVLLVGNSGAGKTRILHAIDDVCKLAGGRLKNISSSFEMKVKFEIAENGNVFDCIWQAQVEYVPLMGIRSEEPNMIVKKEMLIVDNNVILSRDETSVKVLNYSSIPQPKENESLISQYRKEDRLKTIYLEFYKIYFRIFEQDVRGMASEKNYEKVCNFYIEQKISPIKNIIGINVTPFDQLGIIKKVEPEKYDNLIEEIIEEYQEIFPEVEGISYLPNEYRQYGIAIKTNGHWIMQMEISSGMLKTLWNLISMKLLPDGTVVLIDELENGLGVNCIESVSDFIMNTRSNIQIIATSHHPYIINAISMDHWVIIRRENQEVKAYSAKEMSLGKSRHDAYLQLVNRLQD